MKEGLAAKAREALRRSAPNWTCGCSSLDVCPHRDEVWKERAKKLMAAKGDVAMALWNCKDSEHFWKALDLAKVKASAAPERRRSLVQRGNGVSVKRLLEKLRATAVAKLSVADDVCVADAALTELWKQRHCTLSSISIEGAAELINHAGQNGIWEAVDALALSAGDCVTIDLPTSV